MRTMFAGFLAALASFAPASFMEARAADWPTKPIRFILPAVPGGGTDTLARTLQNKLSELLGQRIIIENRPGAAFIVSTELLARANDGHTIGMIVVNTHAANVSVQSRLPYDSIKDFTPIINLISSPNIIAVHPSLPMTTLADLIAEAKANPGKVFYATSGIAGGQHFAGETLKFRAGIDMVHVPYKGSGASLQDAVSGQIKVIFANVISGGPFVTSGSLRALAVTSLKRSPFFPDVPTVDEQGYPGISVEDSYGIAGPANMPPEVVKKLHDAFRTAMLDPEMQPKLKQQGIVPNLLGTAEFKKFIEDEIVKLREIAERAGIKGEQ